LKGARIGVIRSIDTRTDPASPDYKSVRVVVDRAIGDLKRLGAEIVDPVNIPDLTGRTLKVYDGNVFETEAATDQYLAQHPNAPVKTLREILLSGKVAPSRTRVLMSVVGHTTDEPAYLQLLKMKEALREAVLKAMADDRLDAFVYATFDHPPVIIPPDAMTRTVVDSTGPGNNRRLAPAIGFPAMTVPAGFSAGGLPVGLEFMARAFGEPTLFKLAYAYEQGTHHRKPPRLTPALQGEP
jgi:Asp-tRNA(Asn)/Glu-tRNA(Gln) amidotransferase A subunit family amidase